MVECICGMLVDSICQVWDMIVFIVGKDKVMIILYVLGWMQYLIGVQNVCVGIMVQLLLGNIGVVGGGMNVLCGYFNIQGLIDIGLMFDLLFGYLMLFKQDEQDYNVYIVKCMQKFLCVNQMLFWQNYLKFYVSLMKLWWGDVVIVDNNWCFDYLFKFDKLYDMLQVYELMNEGKIYGYICQGFNFLVLVLNKGKLISVFFKLKFMVSMDLLEIEIIVFWQNYGVLNDVDLSMIQIEVFCLLIMFFVEENGVVVNFLCWLQWYWKGVNLLGEVCSDIEIMFELFYCIKVMYEKDGGVWWELVCDLVWNYVNFEVLMFEELVMEYNGKVLMDVFDLKDLIRLVCKVGEQLVMFGDLCDDGSIVFGCWIYIGVWGLIGNMMVWCDNSDLIGIGNILGWVWVWLVNCCVMYNCVLCDVVGQLFDLCCMLLVWNGKNWGNVDVLDFKVDEDFVGGMGLFIMNLEGIVCFFVKVGMVEGLFLEYYELFDILLCSNLFSFG